VPAHLTATRGLQSPPEDLYTTYCNPDSITVTGG